MKHTQPPQHVFVARTEPTFNLDALAALDSVNEQRTASDIIMTPMVSTPALPIQPPTLAHCLPDSAPFTTNADAHAPHTPMVLNESMVVDYLLEHRSFFQDHPYLLKRLELPHTVGANTISLQAKQVNVLRQSLNTNEERLEALLNNAKANEIIAQGLHQITLCLLAQRSVGALLEAAQEAIAHVFGLQDTAVRLWGTEEIYHKQACNQVVDEDIKVFANDLKQPYCGTNVNFSATQWLPRPVASLGMVALRVTPNAKAFGLFVIGSQDVGHFTSDKNTAFLSFLGQILSASLGRMLPPYS